MATIPPYWGPWFSIWKNRLGDPATEEGRAFLTERSPLTHIDRAVRPILIAQGMQDVRVGGGGIRADGERAEEPRRAGHWARLRSKSSGFETAARLRIDEQGEDFRMMIADMLLEHFH